MPSSSMWWGASFLAALSTACSFTDSLGSGDPQTRPSDDAEAPPPMSPADCGGVPAGGSEERVRYAKERVAFDESCTSEVQRRTCNDGELGAWSGSFRFERCIVEEECDSGVTRTAPTPCGLNGRGDSEERCVDGRWEEAGRCDDPDVCADGTIEGEAAGCGVNGRGARTYLCVAGQWQPQACVDSDTCEDGATRSDATRCGLNERGFARESCEAGGWVTQSCADPDICKDGAVEVESCGLFGTGERKRVCEVGQLGSFDACDEPSAKQVVALNDRTCVLLEDGAARCWGQDVYGENAVPGDARFQQVAATDDSTCGLLLDGTLRCWGRPMSNVPTERFRTIGSDESDYSFTGLTLDGHFTRWGYLQYSLDYGGVFTQYNPTSAALSAIDASGAVFWSAPSGFEYYRPSGVLPNTDGPYIDSANGCGLRADGSVHCLSSLGVQPSSTLNGRYRRLFSWRGRWPQLKILCAIDTEGRVACESDQPKPSPPPGAGFASVSAGVRHSCGVTESGELRCAGEYETFVPPLPADERFTRLRGGTHSVCGRRGDGSWTCWGPVGAYAAPDEAFPDVAVGAFNACGLRADGTAVCWGNGDTGLNQVPNVLRYTQLDLGDIYACGVTTPETGERRVACWGGGSAGSARAEWTYGVGAPDQFVSVAANRYLCIRSDGKVRCGYTHRGLESPIAGAEQLVRFEAGGENLCGLTSDGTARCFGYSHFVPPSGVFESLVIDGSACGLRAGGKAECFGHRSAGTANVPAGEAFVQLVAGREYTCGLRADGSVRCWGFYDFGQAAWPVAEE